MIACTAAPAPTTAEGKLRAKLGIPPEAKRVILFQQSAHLDIDWQRSFDDYYATFVQDILLEARAISTSTPRSWRRGRRTPRAARCTSSAAA